MHYGFQLTTEHCVLMIYEAFPQEAVLLQHVFAITIYFIIYLLTVRHHSQMNAENTCMHFIKVQLLLRILKSFGSKSAECSACGLVLHMKSRVSVCN